MKKSSIKYIFKIEYILILISLFAFTSTILFKNEGTKNIFELDLMISELEMSYSNNSKSFFPSKEYCDNLKQKFLPLTYYNEEIDNQLNLLISLLLNKDESNYNNEQQDNFLETCVSLQKLIRLNQTELNFGYESILLSSLFLLFIAIGVILYKYFIQKNELATLQSIENAKKNFSRDLHDGAAQDLAALKLYLQNNDKEKASFYAEQAFKEVRYLIDSTHLDLSSGFEEVIIETLHSFEKNFSIKTEYFFASQGIKKLALETQIELLRILQESLSNAARHSGANLITVRITDIVNFIRFTISDNGTGFSEYEVTNDNTSQNHYGIKNIKDRVNALNGSVEFINNGGTTIAITLQNPLH